MAADSGLVARADGGVDGVFPSDYAQLMSRLLRTSLRAIAVGPALGVPAGR